MSDVKSWNNPNWRGGKINVECDNCGKPLERYPYEIKKHKHHFCNRGCFHQWRSEHMRGANNTHWQGGNRKLVCDYCGKIIEKKRCSIKDHKHHFCNHVCVGRWQAEHLRGKNSPTWQGGTRKTICGYCEKTVEKSPDQIKNHKDHFCNRECHRLWQLEHPKKIGRIEKPTRPERIFQGICKKNDLPFRYVGDGQLWIGKGKKMNPDFIETNGKKICVEIMGAWWHTRLLNQKVREDALQPYREKHYKRYKWQPIFIWDTDILRKDAETFILGALKKEGIYNPDK